MLLVTFGLVKLIFSATAPFTRVAGFTGALGVTGTAVGTPVAAMLTGQAESGLMFVAQLLPCLLVPFSLRLQEVQTRRSNGPRDAAGRRGFAKMPYVAVAATQILLVIALAAVDPDLRIWGVATGVVLITGLVLARQVAAFHDNERLLTELDESMHRLSDQKEWFSALVQHASDLTVVTADGGAVSYASPAAERLLGAAPAGLRMDGWVHPDDLPALRTLIDRLASAPGTNAAAEIRLRHADGGYRWLHVIGTDLRGNPSIGGIVWNGRDVTDARVLQDELRHQANHDALTGLANRTLLGQRLRETRPDARIAVLLLDLDGFKQVNDVHGHHAGDEVLITVARRVEALLGEAGVVARLGGDEFAVLLPDADLTTATELADRIGAAVAEPIPVTGAVVAVGTSIGVAAGTPAEAERMLRDADAAMYQSKQARKAAV
jgi:diguanylate cyclase (GGDEF)-like protein/PAS domain S-box-containing protein